MVLIRYKTELPFFQYNQTKIINARIHLIVYLDTYLSCVSQSHVHIPNLLRMFKAKIDKEMDDKPRSLIKAYVLLCFCNKRDELFKQNKNF